MWAAVALFAALRCVVIAAADVPVVAPDEYGSWAMARYLGGHETLLLMQDMPRYSLISGVVLVPFTWLPVGPVGAYRLSLVALSLCAVASAFLVRATIRRLLGDVPLLGAAAFALVLLWPATLVTGSFTWAEPTVLLWWSSLAWAVVTVWTGDVARDRDRALLVGSIVAGLAPFVHGRFIAVPLIWIASVLALVVLRRGRPDGAPRAGTLVVAGGLLVAGAGVALVADRAATAAIWTDATSEGIPALLGSVTSIPMWRSVAVAFAGQTWYVLVSSAGLAIFGVAMLARLARRGTPGVRAGMLTLGALLASNLLVSTAVMGVGIHGAVEVTTPTTEIRWDNLVFGRYVDAATLVLAVLGVAWLWEPSRRLVPRLAAATGAWACVAAVLITAYASNVLAKDIIAAAIAGVSGWSNDRSHLPMATWTTIGLVAMVLVCATALHGRRTLLCALALLATTGCLLSAQVATSVQAEVPPGEVVEALGDAPRPGAIVAVAADAGAVPMVEYWGFSIQYRLLDEGWQFEYPEVRSDELVDDLRSDAASGTAPEVVALTGDHAPLGPGWTKAAEFEGVTFWRRA